MSNRNYSNSRILVKDCSSNHNHALNPRMCVHNKLHENSSNEVARSWIRWSDSVDPSKHPWGLHCFNALVISYERTWTLTPPSQAPLLGFQTLFFFSSFSVCGSVFGLWIGVTRPVNKEFIWFHWTRRVTGEVWQDWSVRIDTLDHIWHNYYISFLRGLSLVSLIAFISNQSTKPVDGWCIVSVLHLRQRPVWWSLGGPRSVDVVEVLKNPVQ